MRESFFPWVLILIISLIHSDLLAEEDPSNLGGRTSPSIGGFAWRTNTPISQTPSGSNSEIHSRDNIVQEFDNQNPPFEDKNNGGYYVRLVADSNANELNNQLCLGQNTISAIRRLFSEDASSTAVSVDIKLPGSENFRVTLPILTMSTNEAREAGSDEPSCYTFALSGSISPLVRIEPGSQSIVLQFNVNYSNASNGEYMRLLAQAAQTATSSFSTGTWIANQLSANTLEVLADNLQSRIDSNLSGRIKNIRTVSLGLDEAGKGFAVSLRRIEQSALTGSRISDSYGAVARIRLDPILSIFASGDRWVTDSTEVLGINIQTEQNRSIRSIFGQIETIAIDIQTLEQFDVDGEDAQKQIARPCRLLDNYLNRNMGLTRRDRLIVKWALLDLYIGYPATPKIHNEACISTIGSSSDIALLQSFEPGYNLIAPNPGTRPITPREIMDRFQDGVHNAYSGGGEAVFGRVFVGNVENIFLSDPAELIPMVGEINNWGIDGLPVLNALAALFGGNSRSYIGCYQYAPNADNQLVGFVFRLGEWETPVAAVARFDIETNRIIGLQFQRPVDLRRAFGFPSEWATRVECGAGLFPNT